MHLITRMDAFSIQYTNASDRHFCVRIAKPIRSKLTFSSIQFGGQLAPNPRSAIDQILTDLLPSFAAGLMLMIDWLKEGRDGAEEVFT